MASGDMIMKLLLNTADFDGKIGKSKKQVSGFSAVGKAAFDGLGGALTKLAGVAGVAMGGFELFNKAINSSQELTDAFGRNMEVAKSGVNNLVYAVANLDFTPLSDGMAAMAQRAREMYDAFDQLTNTMMSAGYISAKTGSEYKELMVGARNKNLTPEERRGFLEQARSRQERLIEAQKVVAQDSKAAIKSALRASTGLDVNDIAEAYIERAFDIDTSYDRDAAKAAIKEKYDKYLAGLNAITSKINDEYTSTVSTPMLGSVTTAKEGYDEALRTAAAAYKKENAQVITEYTLLFREQDEQLQTLYSTATNAISALNQVSEMSNTFNEVERAIETDAKNMETAAQKAAVSMAKERAEVKALREEVDLLMNTGGFDTKAVGPGKASVGELPKAVGSIDPTKAWSEFNVKAIEERGKALSDMTEGVSLLSSAFGELGGNIGGAVGGLLAFGQSAADAVTQIIALIGYIQAEKIAHDENSDSAMKEAAAKTLSSYAGIPFAGIALGAAAVASLIGVMAALPKFAEGGIVTSATLGVFGEAGPEAVMPLDKLNDYVAPREVRVTGTIKGAGKDLVCVIDNYEKVRRVYNG